MASTKWISFTVSKSNIWNLGMLGFLEGEKLVYQEKKTIRKEENQHQIQPPHDVNTENPTQAALVRDECCHNFAFLQLPKKSNTLVNFTREINNSFSSRPHSPSNIFPL